MQQNPSCPSCGAPLRFSSSVTVSVVCSYCRMLVVRRDVDVEALGKLAALPPDFSPLQIGTEGKFDGLAFSLIGRRKMAWEAGVWNEWFIFCGGGRKGWLAEAQGSYAISFAVSPNQLDGKLRERILDSNEVRHLLEKFPATETKSTGQPLFDIHKIPGKLADSVGVKAGIIKAKGDLLRSRLRIGKKPYYATDIKRAICIGLEGQLPLILRQGQAVICIDAMDENGGFASIELSNNELSVFAGRYVDWREIQAKNLRPLEGWNERTDA